jgi:alpha-beta hydrolase superfamily lysophospholipase
MAELDMLVMMKMVEGMHMHSAEDLLRSIDAPTLIIVGDKDNFTPPWLGRVMASRIPIAELLVVPGGTHGTIIEEPKLVNRSIVDFLERHLNAEGKPALRVVGTRPKRRTAAAKTPARSTRSGDTTSS